MTFFKLLLPFSYPAKAGLFIFLFFLFTSNVSAKNYFVAKNGNDKAKGTLTSPFLTIGKAASIARPGDVITVREGVYREWVNPSRGGKSDKKRIVYQAMPGENVTISGSEVMKGWRKEGDYWRVSIPISFFGEMNPFSTLSRHPEYVEEDETSNGWGWLMYGRWTHRGDVYINNEGLIERQTLAELKQRLSWYTKTENNITEIWANFGESNPNEEHVEINVRGQAFFPSKSGQSYITVKGFTIKHIANHWAPPTEFQPGAIAPNGGHHWIIEDNNIEYAKAVAISIGNPTSQQIELNDAHHIIRNNIIRRPGQAGIAGETWNNYSKIIGNMIEEVNYREEFGGWETAAIKLHKSKYIVIENNYINGVHTLEGENGAAHGIWIDYQNRHIRISRNIISNVERDGLLFEANWQGPALIDNNVFIGGAINTMSSQAEAWVHNLFVGVEPRWKNQDYGGRAPIKHARWYNNIFTGVGLSGLPDEETYRANHNLYLGGAKKSGIESASLEKLFNPDYKIEKNNSKIVLSFVWSSEKTEMDNILISAKQLELPIKDRYSDDLLGINDFNGVEIDKETVGAGPFSQLREGLNIIELYHFPEAYSKVESARVALQ